MKLGNKVHFSTLALLGFLIVFTSGCKKEETAQIPVVSTSSPSDVTPTTATCGGNVTSSGGATVTGRGVCWGVNPNPTILDNKTVDGNGTGIFTSSITGLSPGTTYYIRAYATNSVGTVYGDQVTITPIATLPTITTTNVSVFTATTAYSGGNITNDGGAAVSAKGVCWSINQNPTIADAKTMDGTGSDSFSSFVAILNPNSTYYIRAYATNSIGIVYGNQVTVTTKAIMKYLKPSYELSNFDLWLDRNNLYNNGTPITIDANPLSVIQFCQLDINGDGKEDLFSYDSYPLNIDPTPNPPPSMFINGGAILNKVSWTGPVIADPHGVKLLVGDFNNDSWPDVFSLVAVDAPNGAFPTLHDTNHLLFNSPSGFNKVMEISSQLGFWYSGCSGDIDNDGDLDVIIFNFHFTTNGVKSKILWNDGQGNFTFDANGIGDIPFADQTELIDINNDGYLDLAMDFISSITPRVNDFRVMFGNGKGFSLTNSTSFLIDGSKFLQDIDAADIDGNGTKEIIVSGENGGNYFIEIYMSGDNGKSFVNKTSQYVDNNVCTKFGHMRVQDIDNNGKIDIFSADKSENIRWEFNGSMFIRK